MDGQGKVLMLTVQAKNAKKDTVLLEIGKSKFTLNKMALYTSGISGISSSKQEAVKILHTKPSHLKFTNKSPDRVTVEIQSVWEVKAWKKND